MRLIDGPSAEESTRVRATAAEVWPIVSDIRLSVGTGCELQTVHWLDDRVETTSELGRRFAGENANSVMGTWRTVSTVTELDPPRTFEWTVGDLDDPISRWRFVVDDATTGCTIRHQVRLGLGESGLSRAIAARPDREQRIIESRLADLRAAMRATLTKVAAGLSARQPPPDEQASRPAGPCSPTET